MKDEGHRCQPSAVDSMVCAYFWDTVNLRALTAVFGIRFFQVSKALARNLAVLSPAKLQAKALATCHLLLVTCYLLLAT